MSAQVTDMFYINKLIVNWYQQRRKIYDESHEQELLAFFASHKYNKDKLYTHAAFCRHFLRCGNPINMFENALCLQNRDLCTGDILHADRIYAHIKNIISHKSIGVDFFEYEKIANVMIRCHKLIIMNDNEHFEIRFNIFLNCAETFIHNHQSHFISICISGGFVHDFWRCNDQSIDCVFHKYSRVDANVVQYDGIKRGEIQHVKRSIHQKNDKYFLHRDTLHTVCTPKSKMYDELKNSYDSCYDIDANTKEKILQNDAITFVVRSKKRKENKTTIISNDFVDPKSTVNAGGKTSLSHSDKIKVIKLLFKSMN